MFGPKLRALRSAAGLTQQQLADLAGVSQRAVAHWEQGLRQPTWDAVQALARALGTDCRAFQTDPSELTTPATPAPRGRPRTADTVFGSGVAFDRVPATPELPELPKLPPTRPKKGKKK